MRSMKVVGYITVYPNKPKEQGLDDREIGLFAQANPKFKGTWMYGENDPRNGIGEDGDIYVELDGMPHSFYGPQGFDQFIAFVAKEMAQDPLVIAPNYTEA